MGTNDSLPFDGDDNDNNNDNDDDNNDNDHHFSIFKIFNKTNDTLSHVTCSSDSIIQC